MRLVEDGTLKLDENVNDRLTSCGCRAMPSMRLERSPLRGLLNMTSGIGVPGFLGYEVGTPVPTLTDVLNGVVPANSAPVTVIAVPGSAYIPAVAMRSRKR